MTLGMLLAGCGPLVGLDGGETGSADTGATEGETEDASADETEDTSADETGDACQWEPQTLPGVFDPGPTCAHLVSSDQVAPVTLRVVNAGPSLVHLVGAGSCNSRHFALQDAESQWFPVPHCTNICEAALENDCGCLSNCPQPVTIALLPGASYELAWEGWTAQRTEASEECAGECPGECALRVAPALGTMQAHLGIAMSLDCEDCTCTPNAEGWCELPGVFAAVTNDVVQAVDWPPTCPVIELTVQ